MTYDAEKIVPYSEDEKKGAQVERMFDSIAGQYDTLNHTLSFSIDKIWRKKGIKMLKENNPKAILDIATGTGDLAIKANELLKPEKILAIDISEGMMEVGRQKVDKLGLSEVISFEKQDCTSLELEANSYDAAMVAFGVRNFENLDKGLSEICRVLKPGGQLMILEFSNPQRFPMKQAYSIYSQVVIPTIGRMISKNKEAYTYLPTSIKAFIQGDEMVNTLKKTGFSKAIYKTYTMGICSMYLATK